MSETIQFVPGWNGGARSVDVIERNGAFTFQLGQRTGIAIGLAKTVGEGDYSQIEHGFLVQGNLVYIIERCVVKDGPDVYAIDNKTFKIERIDGEVKYYLNNVLLYTSLTESTGAVWLDASLYAMGDAVIDVVMTAIPVTETLTAELGMRFSGFGSESDISYSNSSIRFASTADSLEYGMGDGRWRWFATAGEPADYANSGIRFQAKANGNALLQPDFGNSWLRFVANGEATTDVAGTGAGAFQLFGMGLETNVDWGGGGIRIQSEGAIADMPPVLFWIELDRILLASRYPTTRFSGLWQTRYQQRQERLFTTRYSLTLENHAFYETRYGLLTYDPIQSLSTVGYRDQLINLRTTQYADCPELNHLFGVNYADTTTLTGWFTTDYADAATLATVFASDYADTTLLTKLFTSDYADQPRITSLFVSDYADRPLAHGLVATNYSDYPLIHNTLSLAYSDYPLIHNTLSLAYGDYPLIQSLNVLGYADRPTLTNLIELNYQDFSSLNQVLKLDYADRPTIHHQFVMDYADTYSLSSRFSLNYADRPTLHGQMTIGYADQSTIAQLTMMDYQDRIVIQSLLASGYSDQPLIQSVLDIAYADRTWLRSLVTQRYSDLSAMRSLFTSGYESIDLAPIYECRYSLLDSIAQQLTMGYQSEPENLRTVWMSGFALNDEETVLLTGSCYIEFHGETIAVREVSINTDETSPYYQCSVSLINEVDYRKFAVDSEFIVHLFANAYRFAVDSKAMSRSIDDEGNLQVEMTLEGLSPVVAYAEPRALPITKTWETPILLSAFVQELVGSVTWTGVDDWIPGYRLSAENAIPLELARSTLESIGSLLQSQPDGSLLVRPLWPTSVPNLSLAIDHSINDDRLFSMSEAQENNDWRNRFRILDQEVTTQDTLEFTVDADNALAGWLYAYPSPWRDGLTFRHTRGAPVYLLSPTDEYYEPTLNAEGEIEYEILEFSEGQSATRYPIVALIEFTWLADSLGGVSFVPYTKELIASVNNYSLAQVRYRTRRLKARTGSSEYTSAQYLLEESI